jgi:putative DNA primase/helicase
LWEKFLGDVMLGNKDNIEFLQRMAGYSLTGNTSEQCFAILYGTGGNGKGTFVNTIRNIMGDYAQQASFDSFAVTRNEKTIRNDLAGLVGKRMVSAAEPEAGVRLSEALIKQLTGCDPITVRFLHQEFFEYVPTYKIWLSTNHKPRIVGSDHGIWRRVRLIPFNAKFEGANQDKNMAEKLMAEAPGILNWMIEGCKQWRRDGLPVPKDIEEATASYRSEQDTIAQFVEAKCEKDQTFRVSRGDLYQAYAEWAKATGEHVMSERVLVSAMVERGYKEYRTSRERGWKGIRLFRPAEEPAEQCARVEDVKE